ncbi:MULTISPECIES: FtsX-like permease family protein [Streptomyces]|uniref:FtsX-like permease family protein n=1 Tax=Streptomyces TaxID=1883 RepID=UPI00163C21A6|nr:MULTISPECIES: ABC transporter permease [Streptomyces]MBC2877776.1 ABC transporter permease [Streptomyces sp. TYQ1024]UBI38677.1 ABC transporter permease [Streptomyces mobaraensis]UKW31259.1 ABC transporter permease [Streptomyces sp. TYQ1024]
MRLHRLFLSEARVYPARVLGAAFACAVTAAAVGACGLLLAAVEQSPAGAWVSGAQGVKDTENLLSLLITLMVMSAVMVLGTTVSLWTSQRLPEFAVLRALGATVGRIRALVTTDVLWLAALASVLGVGAGTVPLARWCRSLLVERELLPGSVQLPGAGTTALVGAAVCAAVCCIAVLAGLGAIHAAGRASAIAAVRGGTDQPEGGRRRARLFTGLAMALLLCLPLLVIIMVPQMPDMYRAAMATGLALVLLPTLAVLGPWVIPVLSGPFAAALRLLDRRLGKVAAAGLRGTSGRTAAVAVPVLIALGISTCMLGADTHVNQAVREQTAQALRAHAVVTAHDGVRLPAEPPALRRATAVPVLAARLKTPPSFWEKRPKPQRAWGVDGKALKKVLDLDVTQGDLGRVDTGSCAAGSTVAQAQGWHLGQRVRLTFADGRRQSLRLAAVYQRDFAFPGLLLSRKSVLAHTPDASADRIFLTGDSGAWPTTPGQRVRSQDDYLSRLQPRNPADSFATYLIVAIVTGYALLSAANTCALAQRDRDSERARLRAMGLSRPQLFRLVALETLAATAVGAVLRLTRLPRAPGQPVGPGPVAGFQLAVADGRHRGDARTDRRCVRMRRASRASDRQAVRRGIGVKSLSPVASALSTPVSGHSAPASPR